MLHSIKGLYRDRIPTNRKMANIKTITIQNQIGISEQGILFPSNEQVIAKALLVTINNNETVTTNFLFILFKLT